MKIAEILAVGGSHPPESFLGSSAPNSPLALAKKKLATISAAFVCKTATPLFHIPGSGHHLFPGQQLPGVVERNKRWARLAHPPGQLESLDRQQAEDFIMRHGGTVRTTVSSKTNYLVVGEGEGSPWRCSVPRFAQTISFCFIPHPHWTEDNRFHDRKNSYMTVEPGSWGLFQPPGLLVYFCFILG